MSRCVTQLVVAVLVVSGLIGIAVAGDIVVSDTVRSSAVLQVGDDLPVDYQVSTLRLIVEATPDEVGNVLPLDSVIVDELCRDKDGCELSLQMVNWDAGQPGNVSSRSARLFISETSRWWRISDIDIGGLDDNDATSEWSSWDCYFTDGENGNSINNRADSGVGFGLLNAMGGSYSDATTKCRLVMID